MKVAALYSFRGLCDYTVIFWCNNVYTYSVCSFVMDSVYKVAVFLNSHT